MSSVGAVCICDAAGIVLEIMRDAPFLDLSRALGQPFVALLDPESAFKAFAMFDELRSNGSVVDWELAAKVADEITEIRVTGVTSAGRSMLIATVAGDENTELVHELMQMNNEHTNALRAALRQGAGRERDAATLDQMTQLNNEMAAIQRELAKNNAELDRLNAQKNAILGIVAHELRNPLGVVLSFSRLMLRNSDQLSARHVRFLEVISSSTKVMSEMVKDLLDISAIEAGKLSLARQPLDFVELVARAIALNEMAASDKAITITLARVDEPVWVEGDPRRLDQVINNLLSNAIKYSCAGTGVEVEFDVDATHVTVEVRDHGQGIPAAEIADVFEAFRTTSVKATAGEKSTGLGLAIAKQIVDGHDGRIWVESEVGVGSSFRVRIPRCEARPDASGGSLLPTSRAR